MTSWRLLPLRLLLAICAGFGLAASFAPLSWSWLLPPAVAGFFVSIAGLRSRIAWLPGWCFGIAFYFTHIWWMHAVSTGAWAALAGIESAFYALLASICAVLVRRDRWPLWVAAAWVSTEVWRSQWPFSGMPWGRLAFAVVDTPAQSSLGYVGMVGTSYLLAALGAWLAWFVITPGRRIEGAAAALGMVAVFAVTTWFPYAGTVSGTLRVAAVQGNVPGPGNSILYDYRGVTANHAQATIELADRVASGDAALPDLVVWPENSTAIDPFLDSWTYQQITAAVQAIGVPVLVGAVVDDGTAYALNQGIVWSPATGAGGRYTKRHPVPYGEYLPYRSYLHVKFGELATLSRDMRAGVRSTPLQIDGAAIADAICFDVAYDDGLRAQISHGAQLVTVQTSNATYIFTDQVEQQFDISRLRAIESGKWVVVASTNGLSGIIAPDGRVVDTAAKRTTAVLEDDVQLIDGTSPGVLLGVWWGRVSIAATLGGLLLAALTYRRSRTMHRPGEASSSSPSTTDEGTLGE